MNAIQELMSAVPEKETIFHYTSQEGLLGIIQTKSLWASSIRHLSDSAEFGYSVELVREKLKRRLQAERGAWNGFYGAVLEGLDAVKDMTLFVGSFSENSDLLSQWRAYTPNGTGFSVGYKYSYLKSLADSQGFSIVKCSYRESEHDTILNELINIAGEAVIDGNFEKAVTAFFVGLFHVAPALKHPSFSEEQEWRLFSNIISLGDPATRFRAGKSMLIPYVEFKLADSTDKMSVSQIFVGPTPHRDQSISSLTFLLLAHGINDCAIVASLTPYRSW
jgi:hypothetical protein